MTRRVKDVTQKVGSGATPRGGAAVYKQSGVPFVRSQNVLDLSISRNGIAFLDEEASNALRNVTVKSGDVLVNITGDSVARVAIWEADEEARVSQHVAILRPNPLQVNSRYLQYWLFVEPQKSSLLTLASAGASRPALTKTMLENFPFGPHSLVEQKAIAEVLGALDDKIAANRRVVEAAQGLAVSRVGALQESCSLGELVSVARTTLRPEQMDSAGVRLFSLPACDVGYADTVLPDEIKSNKQLIESPLVLVSKLNPRIPRIWAVDPVPEVMSVSSTEFVQLVPRSDLGVGALWAALLAPSFSTALLEYVAGTTGSHQRVRPSDMGQVKVRDIRTLSEVNGTLLTQLCRLHNERMEENRTLAATRDELLPLLMSGKITVKDAERRVEKEV
ncbi:hypothetical protein G7066_14905 [Leucobacter coleopterorum]|uniref:Type I restriction modification DNA specificity domain-containing protein n=1 Tax=Leucobacter coleopterorum TaxID=2714933 RepID=A0ABX6JYZ0_9MICO|nr:hypothetical protein G7066_14905 [Leucobacter coleopterorum]